MIVPILLALDVAAPRSAQAASFGERALA